MKIKNIREFRPEDIKASLATKWESGYYSWEIGAVRRVESPWIIIAKRKIYEYLIDY